MIKLMNKYYKLVHTYNKWMIYSYDLSYKSVIN